MNVCAVVVCPRLDIARALDRAGGWRAGCAARAGWQGQCWPMGAPKRPPPERPPLFDEAALRQFIASANFKPSSGCATPRHAVPIVYRAAVRALREVEEDPDATVDDNIAAWREGTRKKLAKQKALPPGLADAIVDEVDFVSSRLVSNADGGDGGTSKLLVETHDGHQVEAVVIRRHGRATTICVSSQVGCQMGCQFCATGTMGILGDLTAAEILEQVSFKRRALFSVAAIFLR